MRNYVAICEMISEKTLQRIDLNCFPKFLNSINDMEERDQFRNGNFSIDLPNSPFKRERIPASVTWKIKNTKWINYYIIKKNYYEEPSMNNLLSRVDQCSASRIPWDSSYWRHPWRLDPSASASRPILIANCANL